MSYESKELTSQMNAQLGALSDAAKYKAAAKAHLTYLGAVMPNTTSTSTDRPKNETGLLATDYAISDYTTWK